MSSGNPAYEHLLLRLRPVNRALRSAARQQAESAARLDRPDLKSICVTDVHVDLLLDDVDEFAQGTQRAAKNPLALTSDEQALEDRLRQDALERQCPLALDALTDRLQLTPSETVALLVCAAPELHAGYERIFAYVLDDLNRRFPCVELICRLVARNHEELMRRRVELGPFGLLRRCGLIEPFGESTTQARTQLRLSAGVLDFLLGSSPRIAGIWRDPEELHVTSDTIGDAVGPARIQRLGRAIADGTIGVVGLWGSEDGATGQVAQEIARAAGKPLRELHIMPESHRPVYGRMRDSIHTAAVLNAILLVRTESLDRMENGTADNAIARHLANCDVPAVITGTSPWRPTQLLANRTYVELPLTGADHDNRTQGWARALPEVRPSSVRALASRFRMSPDEMKAVGRMARAQAALESNGTPALVDDFLDSACAAVAQKTRGRFVASVEARRGPDDLILPPDLHAQVMEIAAFTAVLPQVAETWGFGRLATGGVGVKCLFTGDPGTGKTLAAEVIAGEVGVPLLKVNIAEIVSKWVGETEKNLDAAFQEATTSHAVLFFDEADALFGKRGEVRHGVDRYANLEVSHLLQRLEEHDGLVILASNLKDNIDSAFIRRFQVVLHFPRPGEAERRRIWNLSFPEQAPVDDQVELSTLSRLDMTGAGIVAAARTAALLAAKSGNDTITMAHVVRGVARQFRREARVLPTAELGQYASLLQEQA